MKLCILGNGLTSLCLAKSLVNKGINVDIFSNQKKLGHDKTRTIGISKKNLDFFNKEILNIDKFLWNINKIQIYSDNLKNEKILNFQNGHKTLFSIIRNYDLYNYLHSNLNKNKLIKFKKKITYDDLIKSNYQLIFNCDYSHSISKKFFFKKINKSYDSVAYIAIIKHSKISNNTASQTFTKKGPLAFLPTSSTETSVVYSVKGNQNINFEDAIRGYNSKYKISKITKPISFELKLSHLRSYYHKNIIAFGDILHKIHPLAGQGFNMTIRDIKKIYELIEFKKKHGLDLDTSICSEFEKRSRDKNYLFLNGIDLIYELFNFESKLNTNSLSKSLKFFGKNKIIDNFFTKVADSGLVI